MAARTDARWEAAFDEHRAALAAYLRTAESLGAEAWTRPWAEGKWTPAEVTEHLSLAYEALTAELAGGTPMRVRLPGWRLRLTRWILLPHILFHRSFPVKAPAPRETRPAAAPATPAEGLERLRALGDRFEAEAIRARDAGVRHLTHPYFGAVELRRAVSFCGVHLEHHRRQIAGGG